MEGFWFFLESKSCPKAQQNTLLLCGITTAEFCFEYAEHNLT